jgi:hypothetical protein
MDTAGIKPSTMRAVQYSGYGGGAAALKVRFSSHWLVCFFLEPLWNNDFGEVFGGSSYGSLQKLLICFL